MDVIYSVCCGVDIHKRSIVATIVTTTPQGKTSYINKSFSTLNSDIDAFHDWLISNNCYHVCMESTGKYWIPVFNRLESDIAVCLTHPKYVKAIKGKKTDRKDSKWIADLYRCDLVRNSFIPPKDIRELREISRYRFKLICMRISEKNRIQNALTLSNIGIDRVLSDPFGKTATEIVHYILSCEPDQFDDKACRKLIRKNTKASPDDIIQAIKGYHVEKDQHLKLDLAQGHMEMLDEMIRQTEVELFLRIQPYQSIVDLLVEIPGMTKISATLLLSEIGTDMNVFEDASHFTSWCGLSPASQESAGKKKSVHIGRAGQYLKPLMVQCALAAVKSTKYPYFAIKYRKIRQRRGHKRAIIAIARMMMVCIYHMIKNMEPFNPSDYDELINPKKEKDSMNEKKALEYLAQAGYDVSELKKASIDQ